jgi:TRAP-type C4-dicarboxylate transport system permease small subunit
MARKRVETLEKVIWKTSTILNTIGIALLFVMMVLGAIDVLARYFLGKSIVGTLELSSVMQGMMIFLGWGYTHAVKGNVNVDFVLNSLPPRARGISNLVTSLLSLIFFSLMAWQGIVIAKLHYESGRLLFVINLPMAPFQLFVSVGAIMVSFVIVVDMIHYVLEIKGAK